MQVQLWTREQESLLRAQKNMDKPVRLGIIGCGYVTAMSHLPALPFAEDVQVTALVDARLDLARDLAQQHGVPLYTTNYTEIFDAVDGVIIAVPHHMHMPIALEFLNRGIHTLVEKPMAVTAEECTRMVAAAQQTQAKLAVGLIRRFYDSSLWIKRLLETQFLGEVQRFAAEEAVIFERFRASAFTVLPPAGGVLLDTGPHLLDTLIWWLGNFDQIHYWDDANGGVEANCQLEVVTAQGIPGTVELSRTRQLRNQIQIHCEQGTIRVATNSPTEVWLESRHYSGPLQLHTAVAQEETSPLIRAFARQLSDFAAAIRCNRALHIPGEEGMRSMVAIDQCKRTRSLLPLANWQALNPQILQKVDA